MRADRPLREALCLFAGALCAAAGAAAAQAKPFDAFGLYRHGSVNSVEEVLILPDHSFCLALTAGALDLLTAGRWTATGDTIVLDEIKPPSAPVIVIWQARPEDRGKIVFEFSGQSFGSQGTFVFGTSANDQLPKDIRPLFSADANGFEPTYTLTLPAGTKTFVLGYRPQDQQDQGPYHLLHYRLPEIPAGSGLRLRSAYDEQAAAPAIHAVGRMSEGSLKLDNELFGKPAPITAGDRATCTATLKKAEGAADDGIGQLKPGPKRLPLAKMADVDLRLTASAKPLFKTSYDEPAGAR